MDSNWAAENLQIIRTLMERSAVYRRALAPVMLYNGFLGVLAGTLGSLLRLSEPRVFVGYWVGVGALGLAGSFLLVRRQALKDAEPFWSPPTRRVAQALAPPFCIGFIAGLLGLLAPGWDFLGPGTIPVFWVLLYGCALSSAGFFMQRGIKLLGWIFVVCGCVLMAAHARPPCPAWFADGHKIMGAVFGGLHLAYGIYLYFTEPRSKTA